MQNKAVLLGLVIIVAVLGWLLFANRAQAPAPEAGQQSPTGGEAAGEPQTSGQGASDEGASVGVEVGVTVGAKPAQVVTFSDAGFSPATVTVKKGETVRWTNNSSESVWPASAAHPTHAVYPQKSSTDCFGSSFDACKGLANGESWDFTFTEVGTWKYHDHLKVSKFGTVVVTE